MANIEQKDEVQKAKVAFVINAMATVVAFITCINFMNSGVTWRIICGTFSIVAFTFCTVVTYVRLNKLQKTSREAL